jgi:hypothetical protein
MSRREEGHPSQNRARKGTKQFTAQSRWPFITDVFTPALHLGEESQGKEGLQHQGDWFQSHDWNRHFSPGEVIQRLIYNRGFPISITEARFQFSSENYYYGKSHSFPRVLFFPLTSVLYKSESLSPSLKLVRGHVHSELK